MEKNANSRKINIVLAGTFDLLHSGHFNILYKANAIGNVYVIVRPDDEVYKMKNKKTFQNQDTRLSNISKIVFVKKSIISGYSVASTIELIKKWKIDAIAVGSDHINNKMIDDIAKRGNIKKIVFERTKGISSTNLREKTSS